MGYIKKLKNNELVGGTDKHTIYPVTSTEAVFEEVSKNEFKSQNYLNNHITNERIVDNTIENRKLKDDTIDMGKLNTQLKTIIQNAYDASWKVKEEPFSLETKYDANDVVYDPDTNSSYVSLTADNQGNPVNPEDEGYVEGKWRIIINGISAVESTEVINETVGILEDKFDTLEGNVDEAIEGLDNRIDEIQDDLSSLTAYETAATPSYDAQIPLKNLASTAQVGYYFCTVAGSETVKQVSNAIVSNTAVSQIGAFSLPPSGGHFKVKMSNAHTATSGSVTLRFGSVAATNKPLYYNNEPASASNSWDAGEVISVYYDGSVYQASNAQGGSNRKIDAYLYGDLRTLVVGQTYEVDEAVKTVDKQLLRVTKEIKAMNLTDEITEEDLRVYSGATYRAQNTIKAYTATPSTPYIDGSYAIGSPAGAVVQISVDAETVAALTESVDITITIAGVVCTVSVTSESDAASIASDIVENFGTQDEWGLAVDGTDNTKINLISKVAKDAIPTISSSVGESGVTVGFVADSAYAGSLNVSQYDGSTWTAVADLAAYAATGVWESKNATWLLENVSEQNSVVKDITLSDKHNVVYNGTVAAPRQKHCRYYLPFIFKVGESYKFEAHIPSNASGGALGIYVYQTGQYTNNTSKRIGEIANGKNNVTFSYIPIESSNYQMLGFWNAGTTQNVTLTITHIKNGKSVKDELENVQFSVSQLLDTDYLERLFPGSILDDYEIIDFASLPLRPCGLDASDKWYQQASNNGVAGRHVAIPVDKKDIILIKESVYFYYAWISSDYYNPATTYSSGSNAHTFNGTRLYLSGSDSIIVSPVLGYLIIIPIGGDYLRYPTPQNIIRIKSFKNKDTQLNTISVDSFKTGSTDSTIIECTKTSSGFNFTNHRNVGGNYAWGTIGPLKMGHKYRLTFTAAARVKTTGTYAGMLRLTVNNPGKKVQDFYKTVTLGKTNQTEFDWTFTALENEAYFRVASNDMGAPNYGEATLIIRNVSLIDLGTTDMSLIVPSIMSTITSEINSKIDNLSLLDVADSGFYLVDRYLNIGAYIDETGIHSINM